MVFALIAPTLERVIHKITSIHFTSSTRHPCRFQDWFCTAFRSQSGPSSLHLPRLWSFPWLILLGCLYMRIVVSEMACSHRNYGSSLPLGALHFIMIDSLCFSSLIYALSQLNPQQHVGPVGVVLWATPPSLMMFLLCAAYLFTQTPPSWVGGTLIVGVCLCWSIYGARGAKSMNIIASINLRFPTAMRFLFTLSRR